jgi:hypothetical protein
MQEKWFSDPESLRFIETVNASDRNSMLDSDFTQLIKELVETAKLAAQVFDPADH